MSSWIPDHVEAPSGRLPMSSPATFDLTVSIGTINNFDGLRKCLRSVFASGGKALSMQVVLVSNGGDQAELDRVQAEFPAVEVLRKERPLGWTRTHNLVLKGVRSRYVLVLDDDTELSESLLPGMVCFMDANPTVGVAACRTLNPDGSFQQICGIHHSLGSELRYALKLSSFWPPSLCRDTDHWQEVDWLNGSFMFVRREAVDQAGLLDDYYYTYLAEPDWCFRMRALGWKVAYVPEYELVHVGGEHSINTRNKSYANLIRWHVNRFYFFHKHYRRADQLLLRPVMLLGALIRFVSFSLVYILRPARRDEAGSKIKAYLRVIGLSLAPSPHRLPKYLAQQNEVANAEL
jgi:GT2 family glycosyltransferase